MEKYTKTYKRKLSYPGICHKSFIEGDNMSLEDIQKEIITKMMEYIPNGSNYCITFNYTNENMEEKIHEGIYDVHTCGVGLVEPDTSLQLNFYPNLIKKYGSFTGSYIVPDGVDDVFKFGVKGLIDFATKVSFRKWQQFNCINILSLNKRLICSDALTQDAIDYAFNRINDIVEVCNEAAKAFRQRILEQKDESDQ